jgi:hypothetical protein
MGYLISQIIFCLVLAALIGFIVGWLLRGLGCDNNEEVYEDEAFEGVETESVESESGNIPINTLSSAGEVSEQTFVAEPVTRVAVVAHEIEEIEGIGKSRGDSLRNIDIKTTNDLIEKCLFESGFDQTVNAAGVADSVVKQWICMADLMRVPDVDGQFAELLEACDIKSIQGLANADAQMLTATMEAINVSGDKKIIPDSIPLADSGRVRNWIRDAQSLPDKI